MTLNVEMCNTTEIYCYDLTTESDCAMARARPSDAGPCTCVSWPRVANLSLQPFQLFRAEPRLHAARVRSWTYYDPANPDYGGSCEGQVEESFCPGGERLSPQASLAVSDAAG